MCIIAYVPAGEQIPAHTIKTMFRNNPDGAGIMWKDTERGVISIEKGFMTLSELLAAWKRIPKNAERAIHCRIATSGKISAACCHPFPMSKDIKDCFVTQIDYGAAVMHNGIIPFCTPDEGMLSNVSDTMLFTTKVLAQLKSKLDSEFIRSMIEESINYSRLLIFRANKSTLFFGHWFKNNGVYYSNESYIDHTLKYKRLSCCDDLQAGLGDGLEVDSPLVSTYFEDSIIDL